jgi:antitoxin component YwqK of YwqJK toxin-antitoxin module
MLQKSILSLCLLIPFTLQDIVCTKHIVRKYENGNPKVVVYVIEGTSERVKEEVYFANGNFDYVGHYKNGVEHGEWTYFWPNGKVKSKEYYIRGKEEGTMYDYDETGKAIKEYTYKKGELINEKSIAMAH